jgi:hypothetical protein
MGQGRILVLEHIYILKQEWHRALDMITPIPETNKLSCVIFWVVLWRMVFNSRRFKTLCLFHLHRRVDASTRLWRWNSVPKRRLLNTIRRTWMRIFESTCLWRWNSVPKRRLLNTIRRIWMRIFASICLWRWKRQCSETSAIKQHTPDLDANFRIHLPMKMEQTQCSETSAIKHHTPENNPKCYTRHTEYGESFKSRTNKLFCTDLIY